MWNGLPDPVWRGRRKYWETVRWARTPEVDVAVGLHRKHHSQGWQNDWFLLFRRLGEDQVFYRYLFSQSFQTSGTSVTLSSLSPAWNNANNTVEGVGAALPVSKIRRQQAPHLAAAGANIARYLILPTPVGQLLCRLAKAGEPRRQRLAGVRRL